MDETRPQPLADDLDAPTAPSSPAASAPTRSGFTLRGRRWAYGATLAAAGVLAGSGVTYAVVSADATTPASQSSVQQGGPGAPGAAGPAGAPPQGTAPDGAPNAGGTSTTEGGAT